MCLYVCRHCQFQRSILPSFTNSLLEFHPFDYLLFLRYYAISIIFLSSYPSVFLPLKTRQSKLETTSESLEKVALSLIEPNKYNLFICLGYQKNIANSSGQGHNDLSVSLTRSSLLASIARSFRMLE